MYLALSTGNGFSHKGQVLEGFGYDSGWRIDKHPRMMADVNGDGRDDIVGFSGSGVVLAISTGSGFKSYGMVFDGFDYGSGWRVDKHPRLLADVNGDGRADIVGFSGSGVVLATSSGTDFVGRGTVLKSFDYGHGWHVEKHPRLLADVNGDGRADIVGFGGSGVHLALSTGNGVHLTNLEFHLID